MLTLGSEIYTMIYIRTASLDKALCVGVLKQRNTEIKKYRNKEIKKQRNSVKINRAVFTALILRI